MKQFTKLLQQPWFFLLKFLQVYVTQKGAAAAINNFGSSALGSGSTTLLVNKHWFISCLYEEKRKRRLKNLDIAGAD